MASFSVSGLVPISAAIAGSEGRDHGRIHVLHEQGGGHDERDQAFFFHGDLRKRQERGKRAVSPRCRTGHCGTT